MHCSKNSGGCGFEFCWLCRGKWSEHGSHTGGYYKCNKYQSSEAKKADDAAVDAKTSLEQYMFYFHRYDSHKKARKSMSREQAETKGVILQDVFGVRTADTKFLVEAEEQLLQNRRALEYSYVYGYYFDRAQKERQLFEYLQEDLEKHTEELTRLYEREVASVTCYDECMGWKEAVTNYSRVTKKFLENFIQGVAGGLTS
eukprot:CAMPEP_0119145016 /NCGR_PEP_ID=MMETSP1310-20130426/36872_1 /TAXON_ID=464262 /ORGANISM="Genus nov. species nov., Strain RCC2339" /LENGTH=199 /DNA_ID=CAMNT_0007136805 /DNA_START=1 /DNA_END=600 /DNA_ORIENTATION=+